MTATLSSLSISEQFSGDPIKEKLLSLLSIGVSQAAAARAVGVEDAYVSQLMTLPEFRQEILNLSAANLQKSLEHDESIDKVENKALAALEAKLPFTRSALEAARIFQILNSSKRRSIAGEGTPNQGGATIVQLTLPKAASATLRLNSTNQVIEVEGRAMATLPSKNLPELAKIKSEQRVADQKAAEERLKETTPMHTVIGGVVRVL